MKRRMGVRIFGSRDGLRETRREIKSAKGARVAKRQVFLSRRT